MAAHRNPSLLLLAIVIVATLGGCGPSVGPTDTLMEGSAEPITVHWAPDGKSLFIAETVNDSQRILCVDIAAQGRASTVIGEVFGLSFAVSNERLIYSQVANDGAALFSANCDGSGAVELASEAAWSIRPWVSKDETLVFYTGIQVPPAGCIYRSELAPPRGASRLTHDVDVFDAFPFYDPGRETMYFFRATRFGHASPVGTDSWHDWDLYKLSDGHITRLTHRNFYRLVYAAYSPDGERVIIDVDDSYGLGHPPIPLEGIDGLRAPLPGLADYEVSRGGSHTD